MTDTVNEEDRVELVARAIRDVSQGEGFDYMDFCRNAARAAITALQGVSTTVTEAMIEVMLSRIRGDADDYSKAFDNGVRAAVAMFETTMPAAAPTAPVQDDDAVQAIAEIIDPYSFCDVPFTDDPMLLEMVEQSKQDALRKAERIATRLSADHTGVLKDER